MNLSYNALGYFSYISADYDVVISDCKTEVSLDGTTSCQVWYSSEYGHSGW